MDRAEEVTYFDTAEAEMEKKATKYTFTRYDNDAVNGGLAKCIEIQNKVKEIDDVVNDLISEYHDLVDLYYVFTDFKAAMDSNAISFKNVIDKNNTASHDLADGIIERANVLVSADEDMFALMETLTSKLEKQDDSITGHYEAPRNQETITGHYEAPRNQETITGHYEAPRNQEEIVGHYEAARNQDAITGHYEAPRNQETITGHYEASRNQDEIVGHYEKTLESDEIVGHYEAIIEPENKQTGNIKF